MTDRLGTIAGVEEALGKVLAPIGLQIDATTWKRDLKKGTITLSLKVSGLTEEQLQLFGGER